VLKRFLQPDPSKIEGLRSYVYVGDDPVDATDPSGLMGSSRTLAGPDVTPSGEPEPILPGAGASEGVVADYYFTLVGPLVEAGLLSDEAFLGIEHDLILGTVDNEMQARFALEVARDLRVRIENYSRVVYTTNPVDVIGDVDVETPKVQMEFTYGTRLRGKMGQWNRNSASASQVNPRGKARLLYAPRVSNASIYQAR
jgi:hypothetical protein